MNDMECIYKSLIQRICHDFSSSVSALFLQSGDDPFVRDILERVKKQLDSYRFLFSQNARVSVEDMEGFLPLLQCSCEVIQSSLRCSLNSLMPLVLLIFALDQSFSKKKEVEVRIEFCETNVCVSFPSVFLRNRFLLLQDFEGQEGLSPHNILIYYYVQSLSQHRMLSVVDCTEHEGRIFIILKNREAS